ncbi:MAG: hypothetical protein R8J85_04460 [Mariprofundales bacterium]
MIRYFLTLLIAVVATVGTAYAADSEDLPYQLVALQQQWAQINYKMKRSLREAAFTTLVDDAHGLVEQHPKRAEPLIWEGIIRASLAGATGGLSALGLMKDAKKMLEKAVKIDGTALHGAAYTTLGSFYYMVPGWPIGFGDDDEALRLLKKGLAIAPNDMDANYFMGDYWLDQGKKKRAVTYFEKVLALPAVAQRPLYSKGRKHEAAAKMAGMK